MPFRLGRGRIHGLLGVAHGDERGDPRHVGRGRLTQMDGVTHACTGGHAWVALGRSLMPMKPGRASIRLVQAEIAG